MEKQEPTPTGDGEQAKPEPRGQHVAVNAQILPVGYLVHAAEAPELGDVVLLDLILPSGKIEVIFDPDAGIKLGESMVEKGKLAKTGLQVHGTDTLQRIGKPRGKQSANRQGPRRGRRRR